MTRLVLDAGALIALERNDRKLWGALKLAGSSGSDVLVPSSVLAQVWRGSARQAALARALDHCVIASFDDVARAVGELCGRTRTRDICDAQVALVASHSGDVVYTSDPEDIEALLRACGRRRPIILRC